MSASEDAMVFLKRLDKAEIDIFLWKGTIRVDPRINLGEASKAELLRLRPEIQAELIRRAERLRQSSATHKWLLKKGRKASGKTVPGYLTCGSERWVMRCIQAATLFSIDSIERSLWIVVEPEWLGPITQTDSGVLVASYVKLPDGFGQAAPDGVNVEIASACSACLTPPAALEDTEVVKSED